MMVSPLIAVVGAIVVGVSGHGAVTSYEIGGVTYPGYPSLNAQALQVCDADCSQVMLGMHLQLLQILLRGSGPAITPYSLFQTLQ